ncbi:hypothetical protein M2165_000409 [Variovorax sp. TBS-050B]|uniref:hypothetical protein n=1 Tax=Variovorax sp. TBS-050B TaxID=2940551 RepID=UPI002473E76F|nr:hypothetical protein [Variovorax sp. TBS-050B]MDH6590520.1 hypothetical protein [Variovorax sp. TBS-050B]
MIKRVFSVLTATALLAACASQPRQTAAEAAEPERLSHPRVEIVYNAKPELVVLDTGATPTAGFGGLLGPVGALVAIGVDAASRNNSINQVSSRSKRFQDAVEESSGGDLALHREYAERLAAAMRATGREVKLTPGGRAVGPARKMDLGGLNPAPGYEVMLLRISTSYVAPGLASDFRPTVVVDYALRDDQLKPITWNSVVSNGGSPSYFTYDDLLKEHKTAYAGLREKLFATVGRVMSNDFPKQE